MVSKKASILLERDHASQHRHRGQPDEAEHGNGEEHSVENLETDWVCSHLRCAQIIPDQSQADDQPEGDKHSIADEKVELPTQNVPPRDGIPNGRASRRINAGWYWYWWWCHATDDDSSSATPGREA